MKIECEAIGENQIFPVDKKRVKEIFDGFDIEIHFWKGNTSYVREYKTLPETDRKPEIAHCHLWFSSFSYKYEYSLWIKSFHEKYYSESFRKQFSEVILPGLFEKYLFHKKKLEEGTEESYEYTVYISDGKFVFEENLKA